MITNEHVVRGADAIKVTMSLAGGDTKTLRGKVVAEGRDIREPVTSIMSSPLTRMRLPSFSMTSSTESPMALGLFGEQMENTPRGPFRWGGV